MAETEKTSFGTKIMMVVSIFCIVFGLVKCVQNFTGSEDDDNQNTEVNVQNADEVLQFVQGKWCEELPSSVPSESLYFRLLIEGNKISIWTRMGFDDWNMNRAPDEVHTFEMGELTKQVDGIPCRYLYWNEETLLTRSISTLHVTKCCILFSGSVRPLTQGWK